MPGVTGSGREADKVYISNDVDKDKRDDTNKSLYAYMPMSESFLNVVFAVLKYKNGLPDKCEMEISQTCLLAIFLYAIPTAIYYVTSSLFIK